MSSMNWIFITKTQRSCTQSVGAMAKRLVTPIQKTISSQTMVMDVTGNGCRIFAVGRPPA